MTTSLSFFFRLSSSWISFIAVFLVPLPTEELATFAAPPPAQTTAGGGVGVALLVVPSLPPRAPANEVGNPQVNSVPTSSSLAEAGPLGERTGEMAVD